MSQAAACVLRSRANIALDQLQHDAGRKKTATSCTRSSTVPCKREPIPVCEVRRWENALSTAPSSSASNVARHHLLPGSFPVCLLPSPTATRGRDSPAHKQSISLQCSITAEESSATRPRHSPLQMVSVPVQCGTTATVLWHGPRRSWDTFLVTSCVHLRVRVSFSFSFVCICTFARAIVERHGVPPAASSRLWHTMTAGHCAWSWLSAPQM